MCEVGYMGQSGHNIPTHGPQQPLYKLTLTWGACDVILCTITFIPEPPAWLCNTERLCLFGIYTDFLGGMLTQAKYTFPGLQKTTCPHCNSSQAGITLITTIKTYIKWRVSLGTGRLERLFCELLDLVVQHQHEGTTHSSDHVGPGTLEEGFSSLVLQDLPPAVDRALVHDVSCGNGVMETDA